MKKVTITIPPAWFCVQKTLGKNSLVDLWKKVDLSIELRWQKLYINEEGDIISNDIVTINKFVGVVPENFMDVIKLIQKALNEYWKDIPAPFELVIRKKEGN
jgi:hypothetical protein